MGVTVAVAALISGIVLLTFSSDKAVEHSVHVASALGISSLMIGLILVSVGTDLPEMANSIIACANGHGDIDVGDSLGSVLTQMTLVLGLIAFLSRGFKVRRKEVLVMGVFEILALILAVAVALTGFTREKALLLILCWPVFLYVIRRTIGTTIKREKPSIPETSRHYLYHLVIAALGFVGVAIGALAVVESVIALSSELGIPEFFISFFALAIGTSLPELVVDLTAIRKRQYELAIGDIIGSCIVDATVSISIGQLFFPTPVFVDSPNRALLLALYAIIASAVVITTLALRRKVDRKSGFVFVATYLLSYALLYIT
ncbi:MAG: sodium:calcium antiporter [Candidatus Bathyarchaeota archaeon]|nr:sodium:calcium antiporter [Candidatus Bathyarchaeota archaeon]